MKCIYLHPGMNADSAEYAFIPMGAVGLINRLRARGWEARGVNLPMERAFDPAFDLGARLRDFSDFDLALIDLHWYVHSSGAVEAARREALEETGLLVEVLRQLDTFAFKRGTDVEDSQGVTFHCRVREGRERLSGEHDQLVWASLEQVRGYGLPEGLIRCIELALRTESA